MTTALIVCIAGGAVYVLTVISGRYREFGMLGLVAFGVGLLVALAK